MGVLVDSVLAEVGHAPEWGSGFRGCPPKHLPSLNWNAGHFESSSVSCCLAKAQSRGEAGKGRLRHLGEDQALL